MEKLLFIYNPNSGDGHIAANLSALIDVYTKEGFLVTVYPSQKPEDAKEFIAAHCHEFDRVLTAGGDGMLHEAVNGLANAGFPTVLEYLPAGTTNDFANTHQISFDLIEASSQLAKGEVRQIDVGVFNDEYFSYVAACGVGTQVSYETSQEDKKRFGPLAYIVRGLSTVDFQHWENNCIHMEIEWEGGKTEGDFLFVSISNSRYIGGSDKLVTRFSWNDGLLEGLFIKRPMNLIDLNAILAGILRKDYSTDSFVQVQSPWFAVHGEKASWTLDGEYGGMHSDIEIGVRKEALKIKLPVQE